MPKLIDRRGEVFGRLQVLERVGTDQNKKVLWRCRCECGNSVTVVAGSLITGNTTSCGCFFKDRVTKHGGTGKGSYNTWRAMMRRCYNPQDKDFVRYGKRGIAVCQKWHDYQNFVSDMGEPKGEQTLDRIDPYGDYTPENCRWADITTQNRNVRVRPNSVTGHIGVRFRGGKWYAQISSKGKRYSSRAKTTLQEAVEARKQLEAAYWGAR